MFEKIDFENLDEIDFIDLQMMVISLEAKIHQCRKSGFKRLGDNLVSVQRKINDFVEIKRMLGER
jgi:hypothetical protein